MAKKKKKEKSPRSGHSPQMERRNPGKKNRHVSKNTITKSRMVNPPSKDNIEK